MNGSRSTVTGLTVAALCLGMSAVSGAAHATPVTVELKEQPLASALRDFARQTGIQIAIQAELANGKTAPSLSGKFEPADALAALLKGTGLVAYPVNQNTFGIRSASERSLRTSDAATGPMRLAQASEVLNGDAQPSDGSSQRSAVEDRPGGAYELEEIIVTGSHIQNATPTSPVITIRREDIERGGYTTMQDLMARVPQNFSGTTAATQAKTGGNMGFNTQIDLRGLGSEATLTLVNGRRVAAGAGDQARAFDISMIPVAAVERVEILTDGASALYGSDAIAGVVNIILRKDLDGAESSVQYGMNDNDGDHVLASQLLGTTWASGRMLAAVQYDRRDPITNAELGVHTYDLRSQGGGDFRNPLHGQPGTVLPAGYYQGQPFSTITGPGGEPVFFARLPPGDGRNLDVTQLGLNQQSIMDPVPIDATPRQENASLYLTVEQDVGSVTLFADGVFAKRETDLRQINLPIVLAVPPSNAFSPFNEPVLVAYELSELGPIVGEAESKGWFANLGARGRFGGSRWTWEVLATQSNDRFETRTPLTNSAELNARLASPDPGYAFNPFGDGSEQPAGVVEAITGRRSYIGSSDLTGYSGQIQGELLSLPGGRLGVAAGVEHRKEEMDTRIVITGRPDNVRYPEAHRDMEAVFAEVHLPIVGSASARRGLQELSLSLAARHERYSDFGDTTNPKVGVLWRATRDLAIAANWGTSFRAPSLREAFAAVETATNASVLDPRAPGGPRTVFVTQVLGGNPDLREETAEALTLSLQYEPAWLKRARLSAGYFRIDYEDRIRGVADGLSVQYLLSVEDHLPPGIIQRSDDGELQLINLRNINSASTRMSGYDLALGYGWTAGAWGTFDVSVAATIIDEYVDRLTPGSPLLSLKGTVGNPPDWSGRAVIGWSRGGWTANLGVNYVDSLHNISADPRVARRDVDSFVTTDFQMGLSLARSASPLLNGLTLRAGVFNLFDEEAPFVDGLGGGYDPRNHDIGGRTVYVRVSKTFGDAAR